MTSAIVPGEKSHGEEGERPRKGAGELWEESTLSANAGMCLSDAYAGAGERVRVTGNLVSMGERERGGGSPYGKCGVILTRTCGDRSLVE